MTEDCRKSKQFEIKAEYERLIQLNKSIFFILGIAKLSGDKELEKIITSIYFKDEKDFSNEELTYFKGLFEKGNQVKKDLLKIEGE